MVLKKKYQTEESALASYSYTDIAEGTGVTSYYGANGVDGGYILTTSPIYSHNVETSAAVVAGPPYALVSDMDYDVTFNFPQTLRGNAFINVPVGVWGVTGARNYFGRPDVYIRKWDGTNETELSTPVSGAAVFLTTGAGNEAKSRMNGFNIPIPLTHFKKGETLRVTIMTYGYESAGGQGYVSTAHDPKARTGAYFGTDSTVLTANIPFVIDL